MQNSSAWLQRLYSLTMIRTWTGIHQCLQEIIMAAAGEYSGWIVPRALWPQRITKFGPKHSRYRWVMSNKSVLDLHHIWWAPSGLWENMKTEEVTNSLIFKRDQTGFQVVYTRQVYNATNCDNERRIMVVTADSFISEYFSPRVIYQGFPVDGKFGTPKFLVQWGSLQRESTRCPIYMYVALFIIEWYMSTCTRRETELERKFCAVWCDPDCLCTVRCFAFCLIQGKGISPSCCRDVGCFTLWSEKNRSKSGQSLLVA